MRSIEYVYELERSLRRYIRRSSFAPAIIMAHFVHEDIDCHWSLKLFSLKWIILHRSRVQTARGTRRTHRSPARPRPGRSNSNRLSTTNKRATAENDQNHFRKPFKRLSIDQCQQLPERMLITNSDPQVKRRQHTWPFWELLAWVSCTTSPATMASPARLKACASRAFGCNSVTPDEFAVIKPGSHEQKGSTTAADCVARIGASPARTAS